MSPEPAAAPLHLVVAVATYRRPREIAQLVPLLLDQLAAVERADVAHARLVVVDNDPDAGAHSALQPWSDRLTYVVEPRPGISAARNRALDEGADDDLLVFIDDDERPTSGWLAALLTTWRASGAAAVAGPVRSVLSDVDPWIRAGGFFDRRHREGLTTGAAIPVAATNNLLLDLRVVRSLALRFDPGFGLTGGGDSLFTQQLTSAGSRLVWCAEAEVTEVVPGGRLSRRWVLLRQMRSGNSAALVDLRVARTITARLAVRRRYLLSGGVRLLAGLGRAGLGVVLRRQTDEARGARTAVRGLGMLAGALGWRYHEYGRPTAVEVAPAAGSGS